MSKRLGLLIVMMLFVSLMTGCFGSDDDSTSTTPATAASVVITGSIPALSAPAGAPNYMVAYGTNYEMGVFNAATMTEITGSAVVISGTTYTATVPAGAANVTAIVVIKHKTTGKIVYSALAGILPTTTAMSTAAVSKVTVSGVNLNGESTALATIAKDKGIVAPSVPVTSTVTTMPATVKSAIDAAVGTATLTAITNAVSAVQAVLNNSGVSEATKSSILSVIDAALANVLNAFVTAVKDASAVVNTTIGATTVSVGGQTIGATSTTTDVTTAVNGVTVVTITAVTNPADITVASGTAVTAITFPTTVSVTKSNGTTATASVVWSTTSTPAYVATTAGTYTFTGTVSGTTLTASVKVIVGAAQDTVATPTFTPAAGTYDAAQSVTIACATTGASIYYTTDGTTPTTASTAYTTAINVAATTTIKAIAVKTGMTNSAVASATYTVNISLIPVISAERAVKQANGDVVVSWTTNIVTPTAAKVIVRGSVPTPSDPSVTETVSTTTSHSVTVTADKLAGAYDKLVISYIIGEDGTSKEILKAAIVDAASVVADPVITPAAGTYTSAQSVTITCATAGASIYYTVDGTTPTSASTLYSAAFNVTATATVKAIAIKATMTDSAVVSAAYVITPSTKVLTGITLAKATDTVEANVAYTLPTATAAYDDSTTGAATITWAEGATAVTSPVTKTTAGTYTFTATCTEGTVTKTADFTLVVTEAVPVKTLQSITVTANPTAPTCLVGGTTSVALTVVANYMTGTVASTEEVTTYTTGTNWASGVFTAASTAAGTENIVVTFGGQTANVAVTVTAEAPKVTTVTVTLPTTMTEASSTQAVVLVQDQFGATMTTGFTTTYATTTGTSTVSNTGLVTAGSYSTTAANNAHVLTVTVTPTTGTAVSGTANFTVTADTTKPTIVSVSAIDNKNIVVTYDKKVGSTAIDVTNYSLYHGTTGVTAPLVTTTTGAGTVKISATALFTDATQKIVKITIVGIGSTLSGYPAGGLDAVNYRLYVSGVTDTTSNANTIIASSNYQFLGTTTPDSNKPVINAMAYNKGTGTLVITLDKAVTNALVYTNIKFNGTVLTTAVTNNSNPGGELNKISVTLASADKTTVSAISGDITVTILADAIADSNGNKNIETSMVASLTVPPTMTSASYDETTNTLTLGFSQTLDLSTTTLRALFTNSTNFKMKSSEYGTVALDATDTLLTTSNNATVQVLLSSSHANAFEAIATHTSPKVLAIADSFQNTNGDKNLAQDDSTTDYPGVTLSVVKDTVKPEVTSITFDETTKKLVLNFNVAINKSTVVPGNILLFMDKNKTAFTTTSLTGLTPTEVSDAKTLTFDLSSSNIFTIDAVSLKAAQQGPTDATTPTTYASFVTYVADTFQKSGSVLKNVAVNDKATATTITYTDNVAPAISGNISVANKATISFSFDEKVNKTDAETVANYKIYLMSGGVKQTTQLTVNSVTMTDYVAPSTYTQKSVQIVTGTQTEGATYLLEVANVKDLAGNVISSTDATKYSKQFTGSTTAAPAPTVKSVKIKDNGNQSLDTADYIAVTFDRPVKLNTASTQTVNQNFDLSIGTADFTASYSKENVTMSTDTADLDCVVLIKVDDTLVSDATKKLVVGTTKLDYINGGDLVKDKYSDVAANVATPAVPQLVQSPLGSTTITEALLTDVDNSGTINKGDTLKVTFSNPLKVVTGTLATTNVVFETGAANFGTDASISTTMTTTVSSNTLTVTFGTAPGLLPTHIKLGEDINITDAFLKDSWNITVASSVKKAISTATVAAPYITKVEWVDAFSAAAGPVVAAGPDGLGNTGDYLYVTFNVPVYINDPKAANKWSIAGAAFGQALAEAVKVQNDSKVVRIQLGSSDYNGGGAGTGAPPIVVGTSVSDAQTLTPTVTTVELNTTNMASNITNFSGDAAVVATTINKLTVPSDTTAPTVTSIEFISDTKLKAVFSEAVNVSNYVTTDTSAGLNINGLATRELTAATVDSTDATGKTVIFTVEAGTNVSISEQTNGISASTSTGIKIVDPNGITDLAGNKLAATQTGSNYIAIAKDATAPDADALAYGLNTYKANLALTNAAGTGKIDNSVATAIPYGESALLEVYIGASTPAAATEATKSSVAFATQAGISATDLITGLSMATTGNKIYYRLSDRAGNKSAWLDSTKTVTAATLPDATYKKVTSSSTVANEAYLSGDTLYVGDGTAAQPYDVAANATVKSIMTNVAANDTFITSSGKVTTISATNIAAAATVTLTATDCAAGITVSSHATNKLTLAGSAAAQATNITIAAGHVDITNANLTGTFGITATAATKVVATGRTLTTVSGAQTIEIAGATAATVSGAVTTLNISAAVTTLNVNAAVTTLNVNVANQIVKLAAAAATTKVVLGAYTGTQLHVKDAAFTVDASALTTDQTLAIKADAVALATALAVKLNAVGADAVAANVPNPAAVMDGANTVWLIGSSVAADANTMYSLTNATDLCTLTKVASDVVVTLTKKP